MVADLTALQRKALKSLSSECAYKPGEFIVRGRLGARIGLKTLADLESMGLLTTGHCAWSGQLGYRITQAGEEAARQPAPPKQPRRPARLRELSSPLGKPLSSRLKFKS